MFNVTYGNTATLTAPQTLARIAFSRNPTELGLSDSGEIDFSVNIGTGIGEVHHETWTAAGGVVNFGELQETDAVFSHTENLFFCAGVIPEQYSYRRSTELAYTEAISVQRRLGFPHLIRMWNYLGDINSVNGENLELYKDFCYGRALAFDSLSVSGSSMPAATGVGKSDPGIAWYYIASRFPVKSIENPNQVPAYEYPPRYGPRSPSFSRATRLSSFPGPTSIKSLVSGTAAIVGHQSQHAGDVIGQLDVTFQHLSQFPEGGDAYSEVKVYYRRPQDLPVVAERCLSYFGPNARIFFLNSDICRSELLVEIEGVLKSDDDF